MSLSTGKQKIPKDFVKDELQAAILSTEILPVEYSLISELQRDGQSLLYRAGLGPPAGMAARLSMLQKQASLAEQTLSSPYPILTENVKNNRQSERAGLAADLDMTCGKALWDHRSVFPPGTDLLAKRYPVPSKPCQYRWVRFAAGTM